MLIKKLLAIQTKSISFASLILAGSYLSSALLGLLRDRLLAGRFGAGNELDVYYAAFTIPDFIALILVFGAISSAIIPIFSSYLVSSKQEAWDYAVNLLHIFLFFLIVTCVIFIIFAPFFVALIAPGFSPEKRETTVLLMRIMFLSPIILGISNIMSGILQIFSRFLVTALAPLLYNLGIIVGILFLVPKFGLMGLAFGVILGGICHLLIQIPAFFYSGFTYRPLFRIAHPGVVKTLKLMVPRSLGLGAGQLNTITTTAIASTLATGSITVLSFANNLSSMAVNAFAVSLSTAIFPAMSLAYSRGDKKEFEKKFSSAFLQIIFLTIPISILIFILRAQIVRAILGTGKFGWRIRA
jgi:putative peptidoglycan lipid II flippase